MKAMIGLLLIFAGFAIDYFVITGKLPPQGQPAVASGDFGNSLPTTANTSGNFSATTRQGVSGNVPVATGTSLNSNGPRAGAGRPF